MLGVILDANSLGEGTDLTPLTSLLDDWQIHGATRQADIAQRIKPATVVLSNKVPLTGCHLAGSQVRYISVMATGTNNVDIAYAQAQGIAVSNAVAYATPSVVQHTLALMLALATSLPRYLDDVRAGAWQGSDVFCLVQHPITELAGKTLGIVGYGELGSHLASAAACLGMKVLISARPGEAGTSERTAFAELMQTADVVSLHCPLTDATAGMINAASLKLMKPTAFLINTARGGLVDSAALIAALRAGTLAGAAVDVLDTEPPSADEPLLQAGLPNLLVSPHNAWASHESRWRLVQQMRENIQGFLNGSPPRLVTRQ